MDTALFRALCIAPDSALGDSPGGASISAGAAIDAGIGIDDVLAVALRDRAHGAGIGAGAAADASVADDIGHWEHLQIQCIPILSQI